MTRKIVKEIERAIERLTPPSSLMTLKRAADTVADMPKSVYDLLKPSLEAIVLDWQTKVLTSRCFMTDKPTSDAKHLLQSIYDQINKLRDAHLDPEVREYIGIWDTMDCVDDMGAHEYKDEE